MEVPNPDRIPLRSYRLSRKKSHLDVVGDELQIVLPQWFNESISVKLSELAVTDLDPPLREYTDDEPDAADENEHPGDLLEDESWVYKKALIIPYIATTSPLTDATLLLQFERPVRVPALRGIFMLGTGNTDLGFSYRKSRSADGAYIDGVTLRAVDSTDATACLVQAGAELVDDPQKWQKEHREIIEDVEERELALENLRLADGFRYVGQALFLIGALGAFALKFADDPSWSIIGAVWVAMVLGLVCAGVSRLISK